MRTRFTRPSRARARKPTSEATADVYPAEYSEDVYPTECNEGVVVAVWAGGPWMYGEEVAAKPAHKIYPTERSEGVGGRRLPDRAARGRGDPPTPPPPLFCAEAGAMGGVGGGLPKKEKAYDLPFGLPFQLSIELVVVGDGFYALVVVEEAVVLVGGVKGVAIEAEAHEHALDA